MQKFSLIGLTSILLVFLLTLQVPPDQRVIAAPQLQVVITSTPNSDGSVTHVVQSGESLISIADAYKVSVAEIKALNGLTSDDIFPGDTLIIRVAPTPGPTSTATSTATHTPEPTSTRRPTRTPAPTPHASATPGAASSAANPQPPDRVGSILLGAMITLGIVGAGMMVAGGLLRRKSGHRRS